MGRSRYEDGTGPRYPSRAPAPLATLSPPEEGPAVSRRAVLAAAMLALAVPLTGAAGAGYALRVEPTWLEVTRREVPVPGLPAAFAGLRLAHLSDLHLGPFIGREHIRRAVDTTNELAPDLVALTGDFTYRAPEMARACAEELAALRPRAGSCAVLGNHDIWSAGDSTYRALRQAGITALSDEKVALESGGARLWLVGIRDRGYSGSFGGSVAAFRRAWGGAARALEGLVSGTPPDEPRLLLVHNPDFCEMLAPGQVSLALCGHTHGGQVKLPLLGAPVIPSNYGRKYAEGLVAGPACPVHVNRGIGVTWPPIRFSCRPEVSLLTLVPA